MIDCSMTHLLCMRLGTGPSGTTLEPAYCETGRPYLRRTSGLAKPPRPLPRGATVISSVSPRRAAWAGRKPQSLFGWIGPKTLVQPHEWTAFLLRRVAVHIYHLTTANLLKSRTPIITGVTPIIACLTSETQQNRLLEPSLIGVVK